MKQLREQSTYHLFSIQIFICATKMIISTDIGCRVHVLSTVYSYTGSPIDGNQAVVRSTNNILANMESFLE